MATIGRRSFLRRSGVAAAAAAAAPTLLSNARKAKAAPYGALVSDPNGILDLPPGFSYKILDQRGETMTDGYRVPGNPDGMGSFPGPNNTVILLRNHELTTSSGPFGPGQSSPPQSYDSSSVGGVTRVVVDGTTFDKISSNLVLVGTRRNCAGGTSPWGWLTCEENLDSGHGWVFLTKPDAATVQDPIRVPVFGRNNHEASATDFTTRITYHTEDNGESAFYRTVPDDPNAEPGPNYTGTYQALKRVGVDGYATDDMTTGQMFDCEWVDVDDPTAASQSTRSQAFDRGAMSFVRGEGLWIHTDGGIYICSTSGGSTGRGQIFRLIDGATPTLECLISGTGAEFDGPDNIVVAPWGEIFCQEDGSGTQFVRVLTQSGELFDFARNARSTDEFAGGCFSPDGKAMFLNMQGDGITLVITGPFPEVPGGTTTGTTTGATTDDPSTSGTTGTTTDDPSTSGTTGATTDDPSTSGSGSTSGTSATSGTTSASGTGTSGSGSGTSASGSGSSGSTTDDNASGTDSGSGTDGAGGAATEDDEGCACSTDGVTGRSVGVQALLTAAATYAVQRALRGNRSADDVDAAE
jgi:secreted PhoX family phosphatase